MPSIASSDANKISIAAARNLRTGSLCAASGGTGVWWSPAGPISGRPGNIAWRLRCVGAGQGDPGERRESTNHDVPIAGRRTGDRADFAVAVEERPAVEGTGGRLRPESNVEIGVAGPPADGEFQGRPACRNRELPELLRTRGAADIRHRYAVDQRRGCRRCRGATGQGHAREGGEPAN